MEREERRRRIWPKLTSGRIQAIYHPDTVRFRRRGGVPGSCEGCDEPIRETDFTAVSYLSARGRRHWFHPICDALRLVQATELLMMYRAEHREAGTDRWGTRRAQAGSEDNSPPAVS